VVVVWSHNSIKSQWVYEEANHGKSKNVLFPTKIDHVDFPIGFTLLQAVDLVEWAGDSTNSEFEHLVDSIIAKIGRTEYASNQEPKSVQANVDLSGSKTEANGESIEKNTGSSVEKIAAVIVPYDVSESVTKGKSSLMQAQAEGSVVANNLDGIVNTGNIDTLIINNTFIVNDKSQTDQIDKNLENENCGDNNFENPSEKKNKVVEIVNNKDIIDFYYEQIYKSRNDVDMETFRSIYDRRFRKGDLTLLDDNPKTFDDIITALSNYKVNEDSYSVLGHHVDFMLYVLAELGEYNVYEKLFNEKNISGTIGKYRPNLDSAWKKIKLKVRKDKPPYYLSFYFSGDFPKPSKLCCKLHDSGFNEIDIGDECRVIQHNQTWQDAFVEFYNKTLHIKLTELFSSSGKNYEKNQVYFRFYLRQNEIIEIPIHTLPDPRDTGNFLAAHKSSVIIASLDRARYQEDGANNDGYAFQNWNTHCSNIEKCTSDGIKSGKISLSLNAEELRDAVEENHWFWFNQAPELQVLKSVINYGASFFLWPWELRELNQQWIEVTQHLMEMRIDKPLADRHDLFIILRKKFKDKIKIAIFWDDSKRNAFKDQKNFP